MRQIQIVLNSDKATGRRPAGELAPVLGVSTRTIERVRSQFCADGRGMFGAKVRKTPSDKKLYGRLKAHLPALLRPRPPDDDPCWKLQVLAERLVTWQVVEHISTTMPTSSTYVAQVADYKPAWSKEWTKMKSPSLSTNPAAVTA